MFHLLIQNSIIESERGFQNADATTPSSEIKLLSITKETGTKISEENFNGNAREYTILIMCLNKLNTAIKIACLATKLISILLFYVHLVTETCISSFSNRHCLSQVYCIKVQN